MSACVIVRWADCQISPDPVWHVESGDTIDFHLLLRVSNCMMVIFEKRTPLEIMNESKTEMCVVYWERKQARLGQ